MASEHELRPFWQKFFDFNWKFGLALLLAICIPRFILVLHANKTGSYGFIGLIMLLSALAPYVFLSRYGRTKIGITRPENYRVLLVAVLSGILVSFLLYFLGNILYGNSFSNWYMYIAKSYNIPAGIKANDRMILFTIMALTGMTFSPIGEELFFRGIVHSSFAKSMGDKRASLVDSAAFAIVHISHFGLVFINYRWQFLPFATLLWVSGMFLVSILFFLFKKYSGSILGAILCHSAFNLGMIYCIFYLL